MQLCWLKQIAKLSPSGLCSRYSTQGSLLTKRSRKPSDTVAELKRH